MATIAASLATAQAAIGRSEARVLLRVVLQRDDAWLLAHGDADLSAAQSQQYAALVARRSAGEPIAYITGRREFYGRDFAVSPAVLIPRHETELLVELALQRLPASAPHRVLDLGAGSGCIGVTIAAERPQSRVTLVDASEAALEIACANAAHWAPGNTTLLRSDWYAAVAGERFDLIIANPPYVADGDAHLQQGDLRFEPQSALAGGADGLRDLRQIIAQAPLHLRMDGWLLLEHGLDQAAACAQLLAAAGFKEIFNAPDLAGIPRVSGGRLSEMPYAKQMKELQDAVTTASLNYEIWWIFRGDETRPKYAEVMNGYLHYFHAAIGAHFVALLVALYRLYETRSDTYNIPAFLDCIEEDEALKKEDIDQLRNQYAVAKPIWIKVSILRNKVYGHRALDLDINEAFEEAGIQPNELRDLVSQTKKLLNDLNHKLRDSTHAFNLSATHDTLRLLNDLKNQ